MRYLSTAAFRRAVNEDGVAQCVSSTLLMYNVMYSRCGQYDGQASAFTAEAIR